MPAGIAGSYATLVFTLSLTFRSIRVSCLVRLRGSPQRKVPLLRLIEDGVPLARLAAQTALPLRTEKK